MKRVTITMDDKVADWVRIEAARRSISLSRLAGDLLAETLRCGEGYVGAMHEALQFKVWGSSEGPNLSRDEIHMQGGRRRNRPMASRSSTRSGPPPSRSD